MPLAPDIHLIAWNHVDEDGSPIIEVDSDMTHAEADALQGMYAFQSISLLRAIRASDIDAALAREFP